ncbi:MAG TPA: alkaline phosphatase family protein [Acidimicrobiales bacterium]|nr:alkaline phosphatase family protein [Acidimicrobiales bacterium]
MIGGKAGRHLKHSTVASFAASAIIAGTMICSAALSTPSGAQMVAAKKFMLPPIRHVFVLVLENETSTSTFGDPSADPYLAKTLPSEGAYVENYYGTGHESNDNYIAMVSGQAPNPQNQGDCQVYDDFEGAPPEASGTGTPLDGQAVGTGCVFPTSVQTVADQLVAAHFTWKGYMEDMGNVPSRESAACGHPALASQDKTQSAVSGDGYVSRHDPFVYFHSIIDDSAYCDSHVVPLGTTSGKLPSSAPPGTTGLAKDLKSVSTTPNLSFIVPNVCDDGHDYPCTNEKTPTSSAVGDIDAFLEQWVPVITSSPAFRDNGLLVITFDEAAGPPSGDSSSCCGESPGPNTPLPGIDGPGGGKVGAVLLSPYIKKGTRSTTAYNYYALLGSIEDLFHLSRLGMAADVTNTFGSDVYTNG